MPRHPSTRLGTGRRVALELIVAISFSGVLQVVSAYAAKQVPSFTLASAPAV